MPLSLPKKILADIRTDRGSQQLTIPPVFRIALLIGVVGILLLTPSPLPSDVGTGDFRPYWTSAYLLAHGQDFSDPNRIYEVERTLAGWKGAFPMYAWFAPTGNIFLLPYTLFEFGRATYYWFLTNILIICCSALLLWKNKKHKIWIPLLAAFGFSMTLLSLDGGQVNTLVLLGIALYLVLSQSPKRGFIAGAGLVLTTVKAHLVIFTLPVLLLDIVWRKQWRVIAGFVGALLFGGLILQFFYSNWFGSTWRLISHAMGFYRLTPTLPGLLIFLGQGRWSKWIWLVGLACATLIWWIFRNRLDQRTLVDISILAGIALSPVGWSYDQIILLIPLLHVLEWVVDGSVTRTDGLVMGFSLVAGDVITFYQRITVGSEVWYFWVAPFVAIIYSFARQRRLVSASAAIETKAVLALRS